MQFGPRKQGRRQEREVELPLVFERPGHAGEQKPDALISVEVFADQQAEAVTARDRAGDHRRDSFNVQPVRARTITTTADIATTYTGAIQKTRPIYSRVQPLFPEVLTSFPQNRKPVIMKKRLTATDPI